MNVEVFLMAFEKSLISLTVQHDQQIPNLTTLLGYLNVVFTTLFTIEMVFKMVAFKPKVKKSILPHTKIV